MTTLSVDPVPVITAGLTAAGAIVKLTDDELTQLNSPANQAARHAVLLQKDRDRAAQDNIDALKSGDASKVNADLA